jgi:hypothetical protein
MPLLTLPATRTNVSPRLAAAVLCRAAGFGPMVGRTAVPLVEKCLRRESAAARLLGLRVRNVVCCQVQVSVTRRSVVQRSPTKYGVSECDREALKMRMPWSSGDSTRHEKKRGNSNRIVYTCARFYDRMG